MLHELAARDSRLTVIDKPVNEGVDHARFTGLKHAKGKYIAFVDSDDWLSHRNVISRMVETIEKHDVDYVEVQNNHVIDRWGIIKHKPNPAVVGMITQPELMDKYLGSFYGERLLELAMWGKLYRRSTIDKANLKPTGLKTSEDVFFNLYLFPHLRSVYILSEVGFNYRYGGVMTKYSPQTIQRETEIFKKKVAFARKLNRPDVILKAKATLLYNLGEAAHLIIDRTELSAEKVKEAMKEWLALDCWRDFGDLPMTNPFRERMLPIVLNGDVEALYAMAVKNGKSSLKQRLMRRVVRAINRL